jgi:hypothetical protein
MRSFFEGLYSGLWLHEESRLNQLAQTRCIYKCEERRASRPES